ncbi:hypothetical protein IMCC26207_110642 [Actinobacteria bacterium IMCC26207]|nr:hypothetical protein IMCC26207_110642 [Actinobacteria bacterium IMCC26207]
MAIQRVLQVLQDTDATDQNLAALELHKGLSQAGCEVRTLALGPGRTGQLAHAVPVISPSRHSVAAYTQLRTEQRWADAVILQGAGVAQVAALLRITIPTAISLWSEPAEFHAGKRVSWRLAKSFRSGAQLVVHQGAALEVVDRAFAGDRSNSAASAQSAAVTQPQPIQPMQPREPSGVHLIHTGIESLQQTAPSSAATAQATARRRAAKQALGLDPSAMTVRELLPQAVSRSRIRTDQSVNLRQAAITAGVNFIDGRSAAAVEEELLLAGSDVVVDLSCWDGPSLELLQAMQSGAVAITLDLPAISDLIEDHVTGRTLPTDASLDAGLVAVLGQLVSNSSRFSELAATGARRVETEYALGQIQARWLDCLGAGLA